LLLEITLHATSLKAEDAGTVDGRYILGWCGKYPYYLQGFVHSQVQDFYHQQDISLSFFD